MLKCSVQFLVLSPESLLKNLEASGAFPAINCQEDVGFVGRPQQLSAQVTLPAPEELRPITIRSTRGDEFAKMLLSNRELPDDDVHAL